MTVRRDQPLHPAWRGRLHEIIFEADTAAGRTFDVLLLWCIVFSVLAVLLESVAVKGRGRGAGSGERGTGNEDRGERGRLGWKPRPRAR